jgi:hypothetical protein
MTDIIIEHFHCECGHRWEREMEDGLVAIGCPVCRRQHLTNLGRFFLPIAEGAQAMISRPDGSLSDMANLTRCRDALRSFDEAAAS